MNNYLKYGMIGTVVTPIIGFMAILSFHQVDAGYVGVQSLFGSVYEKPLSSGAYFLNPLSVVHDMPIRVLTLHEESEAASSDLQTVSTAITLNYSIDPLHSSDLYKTLGNNPEYIASTIIGPAVNETFKAVIANYTAENLIDKRSEVSADINVLLAKKLSEYHLLVQSINVTDFKFSKTFNEAIEEKVTAQQNVLTAQQTLDRIKIEAQQKIVKAQAEAQSLQLQKSAITPELIQLRQVENQSLAIAKWDGRLPTYTGTNIPFILKQ